MPQYRKVNFGDGGFSPAYIPDEDMKKFDEWVMTVTADDVMQMLMLMANDFNSVKISTGINDNNDLMFRATATCEDLDSSNWGLTLSAFAESPHEALLLLLWKDQYFAQEWPSELQKRKRTRG